MSLHDKPAYNHDALKEALTKHGLPVDTPSQNADSFRLGWTVAIAALPGLVTPLEWEKSTHQKHDGCVEYAETISGTYFICYDSDDFTGYYCDFVYLGNCTWFGSGGANSREVISHHHDDNLTKIKAAAQAHYVAQIMAAFGVGMKIENNNFEK